MEDEIIAKLKPILKEKICKEQDAVYVMVEIRKLLDRTTDSNYPVLRFYCDWTVHTEKDKITPAIKRQIERIYQEVQKENSLKPGINFISRKDSTDFFYMGQLKDELARFLEKLNIGSDLFKYENWISFIKSLVSVLTHQKINNPCDNVRHLEFLTASDKEKIKWNIKYKAKEAEYKEYEMEIKP